LKKFLFSPPTLKNVIYDSSKLVILTVDVSPIGSGWTFGHDDDDEKMCVTKFEAKVLNTQQQDYIHVKRELWNVMTAMKNEKE